jgi:peroxiredoxin
LWAISPQNKEKNEELRQRRQLPFPILADADQAVIREWGVFNDLDPKKRAIPYPATYVINQNGIVQWAHVGMDTRDRPGREQIMAAVLAALQSPG